MNMKWPRVKAGSPLWKIQKIHKQIWDYVIEHGYKPDTPYINNCVCCEYASKIHERVRLLGMDPLPICNYCPMEENNCSQKGSLFDQFLWASDEVQIKKFAAAIRDAPFRKRV